MAEHEEEYYTLTEKGMAYIAMIGAELIGNDPEDWECFELFWNTFESLRMKQEDHDEDV